MSFNIIVRNKGERMAVIRTPAQAARHVVSRENRTEYDNEKRAKEIANKMKCGRPEEKATAVAGMMCISESTARDLINRKSKGMVLDGKID